MQKGKMQLIASQVLLGHLFNPLWHSRMERRRRRGEVTASAIDRYLDKYADAFAAIKVTPVGKSSPEDASKKQSIFTLWLQGEENAPRIVKSCIDSMRRNSGMDVQVLDASSVIEVTELPGFITDMYRTGMMKPAHYSDICRLDLLYRYGGVWMDATDFLPAPIPEEIMRQPFFVYMAGEKLHGSYAFIQNCFIRAEKGNPVVGAWREAIFEYWKREGSAADYFIHQLILKKLVDCNAAVAGLFEAMPAISQCPTHVLWFEKGVMPFNEAEFASIVAAAAFQKTEYKSQLASNPPAGSFAAAIVNYRKEKGKGNCK